MELNDRKLFLIVYLDNHICTNNLYIVANTKIDAIALFMRNMAIKELLITNIVDFGAITDSDLAVLTSELDKRNNAPLWFD